MTSVTTTADVPESSSNRRRAAVWSIPIALAGLVAVWILWPIWPLQPMGSVFIDLQVYRLGVDAWRHGADMYGQLPKTSVGAGLPFIYPPFAALALGPFALLPFSVAAPAFFVCSVLALAVTLYLVARRMWPARSQQGTAVFATLCAAPLALLLEPVHSTLGFGQVNLLLMMLVAADCLTEKPRWPRGVLVGIAAAIKLTPAAFVLYFLVRKDYRSALIAAVTGAVATVASFAILPKESMNYWFGGMGNVSGLSGSAFNTNQSIQGVLARLQVPEPMFTALWLVLGALVLALVVLAMRRVAAHPALALSMNAVFTLLLSPISWSHHWVWIAPALLALVGYVIRLPGRPLGWYAVILAVVAVFVTGPHHWLPSGDDKEFGWTPWEHVMGDTYVWFSVLLVVLLVLHYRRRAGANETAVTVVAAQSEDPKAPPEPVVSGS